MATSLRLVPDTAGAAVAHDSASAPVAVEKRHAPRLLASQVPIAGLRLSPHGAGATLVNISGSGLLAECTVRLKTGSAVTVLFEGDFSPASVPSRVARCAVSAMGGDGLLRYHIGIAFIAPIALDHALARDPAPAEKPPASAESGALTPASTPVPAGVRNRW
jgi:PilZ domain-containing protein